MRIPGGDLAPARRRRYGGSYGRRRRRRNLRLAAGLVLVLAGAGGAYVLRQDDTAVPDRLATTPCPTATARPSAPAAAAARKPLVLPAPAQVRLSVLNGTNHDMLAKHIGDQLAALGFVVTGQANAPSALNGPSRVMFGPGAEPAATLVGHWVPGSTLLGSSKAKPGSVVLVLGSSFVRLATPAEAAAAGRTVPAAPTPAASSAAPRPTAQVPACSS